MMHGNEKIRSKSAGLQGSFASGAFTASAEHVNNAAGHLTPFPPDALVYIGEEKL